METRKVLLSLSGKSADAINFYFNGCYTEETSDGLLFYNPEGEFVCKASCIASFMDYFLRIKNRSTRKLNLYDAIGKLVVAGTKSIYVYANGWYSVMSMNDNLWTLYNSAREKIAEGCKEIKFIKSHGVFFLEKDGIPLVFEACATRKELQSNFLNMVDSSKNLSIELFEYLMNCLEILGWDKN